MIVLSNALQAVAVVISGLLSLYFWIVIIATVLTWVRPDPYNPIVRVLRQLTEPVFYRVRKWLPFTYTSGLDFSPVHSGVFLHHAHCFLLNAATAPQPPPAEVRQKTGKRLATSSVSGNDEHIQKFPHAAGRWLPGEAPSPETWPQGPVRRPTPNI